MGVHVVPNHTALVRTTMRISGYYPALLNDRIGFDTHAVDTMLGIHGTIFAVLCCLSCVHVVISGPPQQHFGAIVPTNKYTIGRESMNRYKPTTLNRENNALDEEPSSQPSGEPSSQPSSAPSSQPTSKPTAEPTGQPSMSPTLQPSAQPTTSPTRGPTQYAVPTSQPSSQPSSQQSALPTSSPSNTPTYAPSAQPTQQPNSAPTRQPVADPTSQPTGQPSSHPSSAPSMSPSSMPTPGGDLSVNWWYLVTSRCEITADNLNTYSDNELLASVVTAFTFVLTDPLNDVEREQVEVSAELITSSNADEQTSIKQPVLPKAVAVNFDSKPTVLWSSNAHDDRYRSAVDVYSNNHDKLKVSRRLAAESRAYYIEAWCPDHPSALKVYQAMERVATDSREIIEPLHEHGLHDVTNATVSNVALSTTTDLPPSLTADDLSPVRITWIILGTIAVFTIGLFLLSRVRYLKYLYCSKTCIEDIMRSWYNMVADGCMMCLRSVGLVSSDLHLYYGSGFDLTTQEEEADFYGEHRGNLPSDNLDIHYGGDNKSLRSKYLEDDDDVSGANGKKSNIRTGISKLFSRMRGQKDAPPVPISPPARHSPDAHSIELSSFHNHRSANNTFRNETISPLSAARYSPSSGSPFQIRSVAHSSGSRLPPDMYRPIGDDLDDIGGFSPAMSANSSMHNKNGGSTDYESFVV